MPGINSNKTTNQSTGGGPNKSGTVSMMGRSRSVRAALVRRASGNVCMALCKK